MQDTADAVASGVDDHRPRVCFSVARVDDDSDVEFPRELQLCRERRPLPVTRRMVVVVVETAFTDGNRTAEQMLADRLDIARGVKRRCIVRVNTRRERDEPGMLGSDGSGSLGGPERFPDAHNTQEAGSPRAGDDVGTIPIEGGIGQMCVAVDQSVPRGRGAGPNKQDRDGTP
jgi:hypothetical protein